MDLDIYEVARYASLWASKDPTRAMENTIFWVLLETELCMVINQRPHLSPALFDSYHNVGKFKTDFHNVYICTKKDLMEEWHALLISGCH